MIPSIAPLSSRPTLRLTSLLALTLAAFPTLISAQQAAVLDYTQLPTCAHQCSILDQAEKNCLPPLAPVSDQTTYQSCYCNSGLLTALKSDQGALCIPVCNQIDAKKVADYYNNLCRAGGPVVTPPSQTTVVTTTTGTGGVAGATGTGLNGKASGGVKVFDEKEPWIDTHWQYIVMAVIIVLAIAFFWIGGIFLRRYFERRADAKRRNLAASDAPYSHTLHSNMRAMSASPYVMSKIHRPGDLGASNYASGDASDGAAGPALTAVGAAGSGSGAKNKLRSRSSTISMGLGGSTKTNTPQPVIWGPHQHLASQRDSYNNSPGSTVPPSPTYAITSPPPTYGGGYGNGGAASYGRNLDANRSDARFSSFRGTRSSLGVEERMDAGSVASGMDGGFGGDGESVGRSYSPGGLRRPEMGGGMGSGDALLTVGSAEGGSESGSGSGSGGHKLQKARHG